MSHNQPPPNPYGQQPEGDGYGQPPANLYGEQPQEGGYGEPQPEQVPPAQPSYGQQADNGWGQPPAPPKGGKGKRVGIIAGAVVVLIAIVLGVLHIVNKDSGGGLSDDGTSYKLTTPATVATAYKKSADPEAADGGFEDSDITLLKQLGVSDPRKVTAGYLDGAASNGKVLQVSGVWGKVKDPKKVADGMMADLRKQMTKGDTESDGSTTELVGLTQTVKPAGADDAIVECQNAKISDAGKSLSTPVCLWADYSTVGFILDVDLSALISGSPGPTVASTAALLAQVRKDIRV